jgi:putative lipoprotein
MMRVMASLLGLVLTACAGAGMSGGDAGSGPGQDERSIGKTMVYECQGYDFIARPGPGEMALWLDDRYLVLSQVRSASGVRYEEGDTSFWTKGDEAVLVLDGERYSSCILSPQRVPWEDARRRGVDFRAVGNEPGWYLEIRRGRQLLFVAAYGMQRVLLEQPTEQDFGDLRLYEASADDVGLRVEVREQECTDSMSGERFPSRVLVTHADRQFHGCGRRLDYPWEK